MQPLASRTFCAPSSFSYSPTEITIGFSATNYSVLEGSGTVNLTIVARGELNRSVEVTIKTSGHSPSGEIDGVNGEKATIITFLYLYMF